jgi:hypothetical protein
MADADRRVGAATRLTNGECLRRPGIGYLVPSIFAASARSDGENEGREAHDRDGGGA